MSLNLRAEMMLSELHRLVVSSPLVLVRHRFCWHNTYTVATASARLRQHNRLAQADATSAKSALSEVATSKNPFHAPVIQC